MSSSEVPGVLAFVNNIETDRAYKAWSPALAGLLTPQSQRQLPMIRRNMFNVVAVLDPGQSFTWSFLEALQYYLQNRVPLR